MDAGDPELVELRQRRLAELERLAAQPKAPGEPVELTDGNFQAFVDSYPVAAVDFWAAWCGPCRIMDPILKDLAKELQGKVAIGKLNVDQHPGAAAAFRVSSIPTLLVFREGRLRDRIVGAVPRAQLLPRLAA